MATPPMGGGLPGQNAPTGPGGPANYGGPPNFAPIQDAINKMVSANVKLADSMADLVERMGRRPGLRKASATS